MSTRTYAQVGNPEDNQDPTLYERDGVSVTEHWLIVEDQRYQIRHLYGLRTARGSRNPPRTRAAIGAGVVLIMIALTARYLDGPGWIGAAIVASIPLAIVVIAAVRTPRSSEMWGEYRGRTVRLLWLENREHFNQICRAITRARERKAV